MIPGAQLTDKQSEYLFYTIRRMNDPMSAQVVEDLKKVGFSDREIGYFRMNKFEVNQYTKHKAPAQSFKEVDEVMSKQLQSDKLAQPMTPFPSDGTGKQQVRDLAKKSMRGTFKNDDALYEELDMVLTYHPESYWKQTNAIRDAKTPLELEKAVAFRKFYNQRCRNVIMMVRAFGYGFGGNERRLKDLEQRECKD